jgi:hypothetical protein
MQGRPAPLKPWFAGSMFPSETFEMRTVLSTLSLAMPGQNAEEVLKTCKLFI